ncbi:hypothetical protein HIM_03287 [Hirsutella minnesotensis 3608]|nr:hypothetical protein HIM_03287 [Hirsutella minnesotensis 3608]
MIVLPRIPTAPKIRGRDVYAATCSNPAKQPVAAWRQPSMLSLIERLPHELQRMVLSHLDYQSLIYLSTMNRYFHRMIDPQRMANGLDKAQFVMRAAKDFPQHRPSEKGHDYRPGNFECYICFRVRSPDHFDMLQPQSAFVDLHGRLIRNREPDPRSDRQIMLRRFCIDCGVKEGLHAPFDCLTTRTGKDLWARCHQRGRRGREEICSWGIIMTLQQDGVG